MTIDTNIEFGPTQELSTITEEPQEAQSVTEMMQNALAQTELKDEFEFIVETLQGPIPVQCTFRRFPGSDDLAGMNISLVEGKSPVYWGNYYDAKNALSAATRLFLGTYKTIDLHGALLTVDYNDIGNRRSVGELGWVLSDYEGELPLPVVPRRESKNKEYQDTWEVAWGQLEYSNNAFNVPFVAAMSGRRYVKDGHYQWARTSYGVCTRVLDILADGNAVVMLQGDLMNYFHLLWNVADAFGQDTARQFSNMSIKMAAKRNNLRRQVQRTYKSQERKRQDGVTINAITSIGKTTLEEGKTYRVLSPNAKNNLLKDFTYDPNDASVMAILPFAKKFVEQREHTIEVVG